jgi:hypothetical protein
MKRTLFAAAAFALFLACAKEAVTPQSSSASSAPAVSSTSSVQPPEAAAAGTVQGIILETMDGGGYTYMKLRTAQGEQWVATPGAKVQTGQTVTVISQMTAEKFQSNTLGRTFDRIVFGTLQTSPTPGATAQAAGAPETAAERMKAPSGANEAPVAKAEGANARTVSEVWRDRAALAQKEVVVRGRVVKASNGIMGTNFLHLRDGSGADTTGDSDLTVTTNDVAGVGEIVTIRGVVSVDKDFGAGYRYPVIVEKASLAK